MSLQGDYPTPRPESGGDPLFTFGLTFDVAEVLAKHGFPEIARAEDLVNLQQALFKFIYDAAPASSPPASSQPSARSPGSVATTEGPVSVAASRPLGEPVQQHRLGEVAVPRPSVVSTTEVTVTSRVPEVTAYRGQFGMVVAYVGDPSSTCVQLVGRPEDLHVLASSLSTAVDEARPRGSVA